MLLSRIYCPAEIFNRFRHASVFLSFKVKFTREPPNDFYLSGNRVQGIIQLVTNDNSKDLHRKYDQLHVELIGELNGFIIDRYRRPNPTQTQIFFRKRAQVKKLPDDDQQLVSYIVFLRTQISIFSRIFFFIIIIFLKEINGFRSYKWVFDGLLDSTLPSSLPPDDDCDPCIFYYAYVYLDDSIEMARKFAFVVFNRTPIPITSQQSLQNYNIKANIQHKGVKLHGCLRNNGLAVPGQTLMLQIEIDNPMEITIKSMRAILKQYRKIVDEETDFIIFSYNLPGFQLQGFKSKFRQSTYELSIPLEKCRVMAPTSSLKNVRYELHIQCHIHGLLKNHFTLTLPVICTTDHQQTLKIMDELKFLPEIPRPISNREEEKPPPSYEDFIASEILPKYEDIIR